MPSYKVTIPVELVLEVYTSDPEAALRLTDHAFQHREPLGAAAFVSMILARNEYARTRVTDAIPQGSAALIITDDKPEPQEYLR